MSVWNIIMTIIAVVCLIAMVGMILYVKHIMDHLEEMLNAAIEDRFEESRYDESRLSRLESKMVDFLSGSMLSSRKIRQKQESIQQTVSDLSHQTKTPIANILLYTELLSQKTEKEENRKLVNRIASQTEKLNFLVQSLVKLSRLENNILTVTRLRQAVQPLLGDMKESYDKAAKEKGISLSVVDSGAFAVYDYKWTKEALGNIVDNAVKYTTSGGKIRISVKEYEMFMAIEVEDNGIGIAEWEQAEIFQRFYRSQSVNQREGVGIGLYLARKIVSLEGGYIKVASKEGKGTVFSVYLER